MQSIHGTVLALKRLILMPSGAIPLIWRLVEGLIERYRSARTEHLFGSPLARLKHKAVFELRRSIYGMIEYTTLAVCLFEEAIEYDADLLKIALRS